MDADFWHNKWISNDIGFHQNQANPLLIKHLSQLSLAPGSRIFLPLCGKTLDIAWLLSQGHRIAGAELSEIAVEQLFQQLDSKPTITRLGKLVHYSALGIDIFCGDIFDLNKDHLGPVDAIYDRAALVALPPAIREHYSAHLMNITKRAPQLLICFDYNQALLAGPPFSVPATEVRQYYESNYQLSLLASCDIPGGLKGQCPATENVWLLNPVS